MKVDRLLFGAAYYDEYMPYDRIETDMEMMKKAGINTIRIAESTWSTWEPEEGRFDFTHLDRMLSAAAEHGISVIVGTPTYAIPSWLAKKSDDILALTHGGQNTYGPRQNMDLTSPIYREYAERMIRKLMERVADHPSVIGYQIDNETHPYDTCGPRAQAMFVEYLKEKFTDIEAFNHEFGLDYWSNRVDNWDNFPDIRQTINASLGAEYCAFQRKIVTDFFNWQIGIVSEYKRPEQFITHNFDFDWHTYSYGMHPEVDQRDAAKNMTVAGCDIYHPSQDGLTGYEVTACGNIIRSLKDDNYLILETEAQGNIEWLPYPGQLRLNAYSHIGNGANSVMYWHWHSIHNAIESYWKGILSHDFSENASYNEISRIGNEFATIGGHLKNLKKINKIAIVLDNRSLTGLNYFPTGTNGKASYNAVFRAFSDALSDMNIEYDVIPADRKRLNNYDIVIIPALYSAKEAFLLSVNKYVQDGGNVIVTFKSGFADEYLKIHNDVQPHIIRECLGIHYDQFTYPKNVPDCSEWMELVTCDTAEEILHYDHKHWGKYSAATINTYGNGNAMYIATLPDKPIIKELIRLMIDQTSFYEPDKLPFERHKNVTVKQGVNEADNHVLFFLNYSDEEVVINNIGGEAVILTGEAYGTDSKQIINQGDAFRLLPWDVVVLEYFDDQTLYDEITPEF